MTNWGSSLFLTTSEKKSCPIKLPETNLTRSYQYENHTTGQAICPSNSLVTQFHVKILVGAAKLRAMSVCYEYRETKWGMVAPGWKIIFSCTPALTGRAPWQTDHHIIQQSLLLVNQKISKKTVPQLLLTITKAIYKLKGYIPWKLSRYSKERKRNQRKTQFSQCAMTNLCIYGTGIAIIEYKWKQCWTLSYF